MLLSRFFLFNYVILDFASLPQVAIFITSDNALHPPHSQYFKNLDNYLTKQIILA